jgi:hypothetical protein
MGAQSIISPKPNRQNDKNPFSSTFLRKPEELPASIILLYGSDGSKITGWPAHCQQLILFFLPAYESRKHARIAEYFGKNRQFQD